MNQCPAEGPRTPGTHCSRNQASARVCTKALDPALKAIEGSRENSFRFKMAAVTFSGSRVRVIDSGSSHPNSEVSFFRSRALSSSSCRRKASSSTSRVGSGGLPRCRIFLRSDPTRRACSEAFWRGRFRLESIRHWVSDRSNVGFPASRRCSVPGMHPAVTYSEMKSVRGAPSIQRTGRREGRAGALDFSRRGSFDSGRISIGLETASKERIPRHFGKVLQPQNWFPACFPCFAVRSFIGEPHLGHAITLGMTDDLRRSWSPQYRSRNRRSNGKCADR